MNFANGLHYDSVPTSDHIIIYTRLVCFFFFFAPDNLGHRSIFKCITITIMPAHVLFPFTILYYFDQFGRHASQGKWIWPKSVACLRSQKQWLVSKNHWSKRPKFTFFFEPYGQLSIIRTEFYLVRSILSLKICSKFNIDSWLCSIECSR